MRLHCARRPAAPWLLPVLLLILLTYKSTGSVHAQASHAVQTLDWPRSDQVLSYRTCGCADACWVAEVSDARTRVLKARLRCDCETLFIYRPGAEPQREVAGPCEDLDRSGDKFGAIAGRLKALLER